ncbi:MAG: DNA polymerase III subunit gamma/tau [Clostridia bacterium]|nr:DNA polymerase III subunit gamma/tau [Clostridia bacterium]
MYQVLYRKYRPRVFSDVVGQKHITDTLSKEIETGKLSHAYLFTGSRGTGKTTCAKILSKAVNCLSPVNGNPCNECEICRGLDSGAILDVVEIDAASNNGVENIRDIREEINFTPAACKYRVYIIDEVHMLSIGAFNALLKTLEEPPAHVKFILATTEVHKLPVTVVSRCQRFDFKRVTPEAMSERMNLIAESEGFTLESEAASLIARISDGGMRDALSLLDQCTGHTKNITAETVLSVAGMTGKDHLFALAEAVREKDSAKALAIISQLYGDSCDMERLASEMINHYRNLMIVKTVRSSDGLIVCTDDELERYRQQSAGYTLESVLNCISLLQDCVANIKRGVNRRIETEMTFIRMSNPLLSDSNEALLTRIADIEFKLKTGSFTQKVPEAAAAPQSAPAVTPAKPESTAEAKPEVKVQTTAFELPKVSAQTSVQEAPSHSFGYEAPAEQNLAPASEEAVAAEGNEALPWAEVLSEILRTNPALWGILNNSEAYINGDYVLIKSDNPTLSEFIKKDGNSRSVKEAVLRVTGKRYRLGLTRSAAPKAAATPKRDPLEDLISRAGSMGINVDIK